MEIPASAAVVPATMWLAMDAVDSPQSHAASALLLRCRHDARRGEIDLVAWEQLYQAIPDVP